MIKIAGKPYEIAETGEQHVLLSREQNYVLVDRIDKTDEESVAHKLNYVIPWAVYEPMGEMLNERAGIAAYVSQVDAHTAADVVMIDCPDCPKEQMASAIRKEANANESSMKFADFTTSPDEEFTKAVADLDEKVQELEQ